MPAAAATVPAYINSLPEDRRKVLKKLRKAIKDNLPKGFKEEMNYGMPGYVVPHSRYPDGYHCDPSLPLPFLGISSRAGHVGLHHMGLYADGKLMKWFEKEYARRDIGKLDAGKSCIRFKKLDKIPYDLVGELCTKITVDQWVATYEKELRR